VNKPVITEKSAIKDTIRDLKKVQGDREEIVLEIVMELVETL
jgi:hypothetical protein